MSVGRRASGGGRKRGGASDGASAHRARAALAAKVALVLGATWFAVEGGEYGTFDLVRQSRAEGALRGEIDSLRVIVDSLTRYRDRLRTDAQLQERIAREEFGMVRGPNEVIYRFADPVDTSAGKGAP